MRLYLLQRATFKKDMVKATKLSKLVDYDYMGSAEYEFGALPKSKARIIDNSDKYKLITIPELATPNGVPFNLYCAEDRADEIVEEIKKYIEKNNPKELISYRLKEHINLAHMYYGFVWSVAPEHDNFWWDIEHDFMCFYGAADRFNAFKRVIANEIEEGKEFFKTKEGKEVLEKSYKRW